MTDRFVESVVFISGGSSGIGAAAARRFTAEGATVVIGDLKASSERPKNAEFHELDVTRLIIFKGATVQGINGRLMFQTWRQMNELLTSGRLDIRPAITHVLPIEDYAAAMDQLKGGSAGKIVLLPWGESAPANGTAAATAHARS